MARRRLRTLLAAASAALALAVPALAGAAANPMSFDYGNSSALSGPTPSPRAWWW